MTKLSASFWQGFVKAADTTGYQESSDPMLQTFYRPDKDAPSPTQQWGVKLDTSLDQGDLAADIGFGMFSSNGSISDVYTGRG